MYIVYLSTFISDTLYTRLIIENIYTRFVLPYNKTSK